MSVDDRTINIRVDQTLVRRGIDTSKISVSAAKGSVLITGFLKARSKHYEIKSSSDMKQLDSSLRRIPNLKSVSWQITNWRREGTTWKKLLGAQEEAGGE